MLASGLLFASMALAQPDDTRPVSRVGPRYPSGLEGAALCHVEVSIDERGRAQRPKAYGCEGGFARAAEETIGRWRWRRSEQPWSWSFGISFFAKGSEPIFTPERCVYRLEGEQLRPEVPGCWIQGQPPQHTVQGQPPQHTVQGQPPQHTVQGQPPQRTAEPEGEAPPSCTVTLAPPDKADFRRELAEHDCSGVWASWVQELLTNARFAPSLEAVLHIQQGS